jgi:GNAT superfamily N-acetyltransferase
MEIVVETPGTDSYAALHDRLVAFNRESAPWSPEGFTVAAYAEDGTLAGGVRGVVNMGLVELRGLWLDPPFRKSGLGARLVARLEDHARALGATRAALWTYDWQARAFYERHGYSVFGTLRYPAGATRYFMEKDLEENRAAPA